MESRRRSKPERDSLRARIIEIIQKEPELPDKQIAIRFRVTVSHVGKLRRKMVAA